MVQNMCYLSTSRMESSIGYQRSSTSRPCEVYSEDCEELARLRKYDAVLAQDLSRDVHRFSVVRQVSFASQVRRRSMPRRRWSAVAASAGWFEIVRGPRSSGARRKARASWTIQVSNRTCTSWPLEGKRIRGSSRRSTVWKLL